MGKGKRALAALLGGGGDIADTYMKLMAQEQGDKRSMYNDLTKMSIMQMLKEASPAGKMDLKYKQALIDKMKRGPQPSMTERLMAQAAGSRAGREAEEYRVKTEEQGSKYQKFLESMGGLGLPQQESRAFEDIITSGQLKPAKIPQPRSQADIYGDMVEEKYGPDEIVSAMDAIRGINQQIASGTLDEKAMLDPKYLDALRKILMTITLEDAISMKLVVDQDDYNQVMFGK